MHDIHYLCKQFSYEINYRCTFLTLTKYLGDSDTGNTKFSSFSCSVDGLFSRPILDESLLLPRKGSWFENAANTNFAFPTNFTVEISIVKLESSLNYAYVLKAKSSWTGVTLESLTRESDRMILMFMWLLEQIQAEYRNNCECSESNSCNILLAAPAVRYARLVRHGAFVFLYLASSSESF